MRSLTLALAATALAASSAQAQFPTGIADGPRQIARQRRKPSVTKYEPDPGAIATWNKEVERKKAEKRAAKRLVGFR